MALKCVPFRTVAETMGKAKNESAAAGASEAQCKFTLHRKLNEEIMIFYKVILVWGMTCGRESIKRAVGLFVIGCIMSDFSYEYGILGLST